MISALFTHHSSAARNLYGFFLTSVACSLFLLGCHAFTVSHRLAPIASPVDFKLHHYQNFAEKLGLKVVRLEQVELPPSKTPLLDGLDEPNEQG
jgi:1,6-anhydro-N-acetylmuramate kinase